MWGLSGVPIGWYYPAALGNPSLLDTVPHPEYGNRLTIRQYRQEWLAIYQRLAGGALPIDGCELAGGGGITGIGSQVPADIAPAIAYAQAQLGKPYVWGGAGPDVFDCSGLALRAYQQIGVSLPHNSAAQANYGVAVIWRSEPIPARRSDLSPRVRPRPRQRSRRHRHQRHPVDRRAQDRRRRLPPAHPIRPRSDRPPPRAAHRLKRRTRPVKPSGVPMHPPTATTGIADAAAEALRRLNHAAIDPASLGMSDAYEVLGSMLDITSRLPQALHQLAGTIACCGERPLYADDGADPHGHITAASDDLECGAELLAAASVHCRWAHSRVARLATRSDSGPTP